MFLRTKLFSSAVSDGLQMAHQRKRKTKEKEIMEDACLRGKKEYFKDLITGHIK